MAAVLAVIRKTRKAVRSTPDESEFPDGLQGKSAVSFQRYSKANLDEMDVHMEKGIRDLPVWKDLVARVGLKEARKILRQGILMNWITGGNPGN